MPVTPPRPPANLRTPSFHTEGTGTTLAEQVTAQTAQGPAFAADSPSVLQILGIDAVPFSFVIGGSAPTLTFPNLPYRNNIANPLSGTIGARQTLRIQPKDHLIFVAFLQGLTAPAGTVVGVTSQAIDNDNLTLAGPFLGANAFTTFQAALACTAAGNGTISGIAVGMLLLSIG